MSVRVTPAMPQGVEACGEGGERGACGGCRSGSRLPCHKGWRYAVGGERGVCGEEGGEVGGGGGSGGVSISR